MSPHCVLAAAHRARSPTSSLSPIRQVLQPSTPISVQYRHARCHHGLDLASMGWCVVGMCHGSGGCSDRGLGPLTQAGGIGNALRVVVMQGMILSLSCYPVTCRPVPTMGQHQPPVPTGVCPSRKRDLGPTALVQPGGVVLDMAPYTLPHRTPSPQLSKAMAGLAFLGGDHLCHAEWSSV